MDTWAVLQFLRVTPTIWKYTEAAWQRGHANPTLSGLSSLRSDEDGSCPALVGQRD
jgi:hypothetical protein